MSPVMVYHTTRLQGANLHEMARLGLRVPPGFTITAELCTYFEKNGKLPDDLWAEVDTGLAHLEKLMNSNFGDGKGLTGQKSAPATPYPNTLLVSVRSGAAISMPGMMASSAHTTGNSIDGEGGPLTRSLIVALWCSAGAINCKV